MKTFNQFLEEAEKEKEEPKKPKPRKAKKAPNRGVHQDRSNWKLFGHQT